MLRLLAVLALILAPSGPPATGVAGSASVGDAAAFAEARDDIDGLMKRRRWKDAYERYQRLFDEHAGAAYVLDRVVAIETDLKRCAFWMTHDEPKLEELLDAKLLRWDAYRGSVSLAFDREHLGDLDEHRSSEGSVFELPAQWDATWNAEFAGPAGVLGGDQVYVLVGDDLAYVVSIGHRGTGASVYYKHVLSMREGDRITTLESAEPKELDDDEKITARVVVTDDRIKVEVDRRTVFDLRRRDDGGYGRFAFSYDQRTADPDFGALEVSGRAETGWFDGLIDAAVQDARDVFDAAWDPAEHMPVWLVGAEKRSAVADDDAPPLGPFPVPETFDLVAQQHPRTPEHVERVEELIEAGELGDALRYLGELAPGEIEPTLRAFLGCVALMCADRPREAFEVGTRLWRDQPGSLTAGYLEAVLHAELKRPDVALERFRSLTAAHPGAWEPWYGLTSLLLIEHRLADAVAALGEGQRRADAPTQLHRLEGRLALLTKGPPWDRTFEETAAHFRVRSDTDARTTRAVARELQQAWRTYERLLGPADLPDGTVIPVYLFSGEATYRAYAKTALSADTKHTAGVFSRELQVVLVWNTPSEEKLLATIRHEVLHQYLDARMGAVPTWFNEGLAEYYEIVDDSRGRPELGGTHALHLPVLRGLREVPDLRAFADGLPGDFYASAEASYPLAWAFVHFLKHTTPDRRSRFERLWERLDGGVDGTTAIDEAFAGVDWERWNAAFLEHLNELSSGGR